MKKSILIVHMLLIFPLLIISFITLSMEHKRQIQNLSNEEIEKLILQIKINHTPVMAELLQRFENQDIPLDETDNIPLNKSNPIAIKQPTPAHPQKIYAETVDMPLPQHILEKHIVNKPDANTPDTTINPLFVSVILPTEAKTLTMIEKFCYFTSTPYQVMMEVINQLEKKTFDVTYATSFDRLKEAVSTAVTNKYIEHLLKIAKLSEENYPNQIRIDDYALAQQANTVLSDHYISELHIKNEQLKKQAQMKRQYWNIATIACIQTICTAIDAHANEMSRIDDLYNTSVAQNDESIKKLRKEISTFSLLNRDIRKNTTKLLKNNQLTPQNEILTTTMQQTNHQFSSIKKQLKNIPTILEFNTEKTPTLTLGQK